MGKSTISTYFDWAQIKVFKQKGPWSLAVVVFVSRPATKEAQIALSLKDQIVSRQLKFLAPAWRSDLTV